jgi:hypothetical protein
LKAEIFKDEGVDHRLARIDRSREFAGERSLDPPSRVV